MEKQLTILLIDDDEINNFLSRELFSLSCPEAVIVSLLHVIDGLALVSKNIHSNLKMPDIILLDINMPVMSGWDFVEEFEKFDKHFTDQINLYIYSSSVYFEDINKAKSYSSVKDIFTKPLTQMMINEICIIR